MWFLDIEPLYVDVGHRVVVFCRFSKPPRVGEVLPKFLIDSIVFLSFLQRRARRSGAKVRRSSFSALRVCMHRVALPLHRLTAALLA
jgi:hypothetical protein